MSLESKDDSEFNIMYASEDGIQLYVEKSTSEDLNESRISGREGVISNIIIPTPGSSVDFHPNEIPKEEEDETPLSASEEVVFSPFEVPESPMSDSPRVPKSFGLLLSEEKEEPKIMFDTNDSSENIPKSVQHPTPSNISNLSITDDFEKTDLIIDEGKILFQVNSNKSSVREPKIDHQEIVRLKQEIEMWKMKYQIESEHSKKEQEGKNEYMKKYNQVHRTVMEERIKNSKKINELLRKETDMITEIEMYKETKKKFSKIIRTLKGREIEQKKLIHGKDSVIQEQNQEISILKKEIEELKNIISDEKDKNNNVSRDVLPLSHHFKKQNTNNIRKHIPPVSTTLPLPSFLDSSEEIASTHHGDGGDNEILQMVDSCIVDSTNMSIMSDISSIFLSDSLAGQQLQQEEELEETSQQVSEDIIEEQQFSVIESAPIDPRMLEQISQRQQDRMDTTAKNKGGNIDFNRWSC